METKEILLKLRNKAGLSQEELAIKLNVVRQTVSKWENGLSVPDSSLLISLADELDTSVSELLGEPITEPATDDLKTISEKLERYFCLYNLLSILFLLSTKNSVKG